MNTFSTPITVQSVVAPPSDGVSSLYFSPKANLLCASSWDNQVRIWEVGASGHANFKVQSSHEAPVLHATWSSDGTRIFSAGCDNKAKCWDLHSNQSIQVAGHTAPIKCCFWIDQISALVTGSWDRTLKYWDLRSNSAVLTVQLPERCYTMDVVHPLLVVGTAEKQLIVYNLANPSVEFKRVATPLKHQTRVVSCIPDKSGFAVGSIEGRVGFHYLDDNRVADNFTFRCHRENNNTDIYAVNSICFHPTYLTFATAGADGTYAFWDKDSKQRLKQFPKGPQAISCANFNADGSLYAYASSYDWSKGATSYNPPLKNDISIMRVNDADVKPKPKKK